MNQMVVLLLLFLQSANPAALPDVPGVYYLRNNTGWLAMKVAPVVEMKTKGMRTFVDSNGYTNLGVIISFPGVQSSLRIQGRIPRFFIRKVGSSKSALIVRLTRKGKQRTCQTYPSGATMENKKGFKKEDILKLTVSENPDGSFSAMPESSLKPGEYLLVVGDASSIYDFGID